MHMNLEKAQGEKLRICFHEAPTWLTRVGNSLARTPYFPYWPRVKFAVARFYARLSTCHIYLNRKVTRESSYFTPMRVRKLASSGSEGQWRPLRKFL